MNARQVAIGKALQELEPDLLDAVLMARLVTSQAEDWLVQRVGGTAAVPGPDADALLFGIYNVSARLKQIHDRFEGVLASAPHAELPKCTGFVASQPDEMLPKTKDGKHSGKRETRD